MNDVRKQLVALLSSAIMVATSVGGAAWALSARMTALEVKLESVDQSVTKIEKTLDMIAPPTVRASLDGGKDENFSLTDSDLAFRVLFNVLPI